jgi:hypothetical protein
MVRTDVSEERFTSIFRAGESRREYREQVAATGRKSRALSLYRKRGLGSGPVETVQVGRVGSGEVK